MHDDPQTRDYFDRFTPHFDPRRFEFALEFLRAAATPEQRVLDIGCGDGATLALVRNQTPLRSLAGLDVSEEYLRRARELLDCNTIHGSIVDPALAERLEGQFDYAIMGAVLHHLIAGTRRSSREAAHAAVDHAFRVLRPGGSLIIFEPTFRPRAATFAAFWLKKLAGTITGGRIHLGASWANLGQPVVSYYTDDQLTSWVREHQPSPQLVTVDRKRLAGLIDRRGVGVIATKDA